MGLTRDTEGKLIRRGRVERVLEADFMNAAAPLPWWLEVQTGTGAHITPATAGAYGGSYRVTSAATNGAFAIMRTTFDLNVGSVEEILLEAQGYQCDTNAGHSPRLQLEGTNAGAYVVNAQYFKRPGGAQFANTGFDFRAASDRRLNVGLLFRPRAKQVALILDDQEANVVTDATIGNSSVIRCGFGLVTTEAVAHWFQVSKIRLTIRTN